MEELETCPLCDGQAKLCHGLPSTQNRGTYQAFVRCKKCGCKTKTFFQAAYESKADVDKAAKDSWNLRVAPKNKEMSCEGCKHISDSAFEPPCDSCMRLKPDWYTTEEK